MLKVGALRNGFTYRKLFHQLEEIVSELLRYLWELGNTFGRAPKFVSFFAFGQTVLLLIYSLSSVQWCPLLQKFRTGSHNQHLPTVGGLDHPDGGWTGRPDGARAGGRG